jgi:hypothetical protein
MNYVEEKKKRIQIKKRFNNIEKKKIWKEKKRVNSIPKNKKESLKQNKKFRNAFPILTK